MAIGFCFLIKDSVNNLELWAAFFEGIASSQYRIYVHAKTPSACAVPDGAVVDSDPLPTAWGELSLVMATQRLFDQALEDGCTSMILLSGDMLPLWPFERIQDQCQGTRFSLQPTEGLTERQSGKNAERYAQMAPWLGLDRSQMMKQNMFFSISSADYQSVRGLSLSDCPLRQLADEYYWVNALTASGRTVRADYFLYCNPDRTRTQACALNLTPELLSECRQRGYLFVRKVAEVESVSASLLKEIYQQVGLSDQGGIAPELAGDPIGIFERLNCSSLIRRLTGDQLRKWLRLFRRK